MLPTLRRIILFVLGVYVVIGAVTDDPIHLLSLLAGLLLLGVVTWEQIESIMRRRNGHQEDTT